MQYFKKKNVSFYRYQRVLTHIFFSLTLYILLYFFNFELQPQLKKRKRYIKKRCQKKELVMLGQVTN